MTTALVTGANKGVGFATVEALARRGMTVWLGARDAEAGRKGAERLVADGLAIRSVSLDVTDGDSIARAVQTIGEAGGLDILVNNAGIMPEARHGVRATRPSEIDRTMLRLLFETHVIGPMELFRQLLPLLRESAAPRVVNVSSRLGSFALQCDASWPGRAVNQLGYSASKAALNMATLMLAHDLEGSGIKINAASPGIVATDLNGLGAEQLAGRPGYASPEEGARIIVECATLDDDGPSGAFFGPDGIVTW